MKQSNYFEISRSLILSFFKTIFGLKAATTDPVHDNELWGFQIWLDRSNVKAYPKDIWVQISAAENKLLCFLQYIIRILFLKASTEILFIVLYTSLAKNQPPKPYF